MAKRDQPLEAWQRPWALAALSCAMCAIPAFPPVFVDDQSTPGPATRYVVVALLAVVGGIVAVTGLFTDAPRSSRRAQADRMAALLERLLIGTGVAGLAVGAFDVATTFWAHRSERTSDDAATLARAGVLGVGAMLIAVAWWLLRKRPSVPTESPVA